VFCWGARLLLFSLYTIQQQQVWLQAASTEERWNSNGQQQGGLLATRLAALTTSIVASRKLSTQLPHVVRCMCLCGVNNPASSQGVPCEVLLQQQI
jgi:hypothetical protein